MYHRYSTALSHVVLAGISIFCLKTYCGFRTECIFKLAQLSYGIIVINSLIGVWKWGNPAHGHTAEKLYSCSRILQKLFIFPCIVGQLWLNYGYDEQLAYLHPTFSLVPLILYLRRSNYYKNEKYFDLIALMNILSCAYVSFNVANWFGVVSAISYAINHFILREESEILDMPSIDFYNYALCFFSFFSVRALQGNL